MNKGQPTKRGVKRAIKLRSNFTTKGPRGAALGGNQSPNNIIITTTSIA